MIRKFYEMSGFDSSAPFEIKNEREILDKHYQPRMHWNGFNRSRVLFAMREHAANEVDFAMERLNEWLMDEKRKPAITAFTSGWLRNVAMTIESKISKE